MSMSVVKLQSSDGQIFDVPLYVVKRFNTLKVMFEALGEAEYEDKDREQGPEDIIPVANVDSATLETVINWALLHKNDLSSKGNGNTNPSKDIGAVDKIFVGGFDMATLKRLMNAANFLDCKGLYDACCKEIALRIAGKSPEEIRKLLEIQNDLTPEEETQITKENELWEKLPEKTTNQKKKGFRK